MDDAPRLPISALLVSCDEAQHLARCLPTIRFCAEILVVDLESTDDTAAVAAAHGARVIGRPRVATVERAREGLPELAAHDWLLFTDPDETFPPDLQQEIAALLPTLPDTVGVVYAPIQYRFGGVPLRGTVWGGIKERRLLVHRRRATIQTTIYAGTALSNGIVATSIPASDGNVIAHDWVDGYRDFLVKHRRYIAASAEDRAANGEVTGIRAILLLPGRAFLESFATKKGYRDGVRGLALSLLWAWYSTRAELALLARLRSVAR